MDLNYKHDYAEKPTSQGFVSPGTIAESALIFFLNKTSHLCYWSSRMIGFKTLLLLFQLEIVLVEKNDNF